MSSLRLDTGQIVNVFASEVDGFGNVTQRTPEALWVEAWDAATEQWQSVPTAVVSIGATDSGETSWSLPPGDDDVVEFASAGRSSFGFRAPGEYRFRWSTPLGPGGSVEKEITVLPSIPVCRRPGDLASLLSNGRTTVDVEHFLPIPAGNAVTSVRHNDTALNPSAFTIEPAPDEPIDGVYISGTLTPTLGWNALTIGVDDVLAGTAREYLCRFQWGDRYDHFSRTEDIEYDEGVEIRPRVVTAFTDEFFMDADGATRDWYGQSNSASEILRDSVARGVLQDRVFDAIDAWNREADEWNEGLADEGQEHLVRDRVDFRTLTIPQFFDEYQRPPESASARAAWLADWDARVAAVSQLVADGMSESEIAEDVAEQIAALEQQLEAASDEAARAGIERQIQDARDAGVASRIAAALEPLGLQALRPRASVTLTAFRCDEWVNRESMFGNELTATRRPYDMDERRTAYEPWDDEHCYSNPPDVRMDEALRRPDQPREFGPFVRAVVEFPMLRYEVRWGRKNHQHISYHLRNVRFGAYFRVTDSPPYLANETPLHYRVYWDGFEAHALNTGAKLANNRDVQNRQGVQTGVSRLGAHVVNAMHEVLVEHIVGMSATDLHNGQRRSNYQQWWEDVDGDGRSTDEELGLVGMGAEVDATFSACGCTNPLVAESATDECSPTCDPVCADNERCTFERDGGGVSTPVCVSDALVRPGVGASYPCSGCTFPNMGLFLDTLGDPQGRSMRDDGEEGLPSGLLPGALDGLERVAGVRRRGSGGTTVSLHHSSNERADVRPRAAQGATTSGPPMLAGVVGRGGELGLLATSQVRVEAETRFETLNTAGIARQWAHLGYEPEWSAPASRSFEIALLNEMLVEWWAGGGAAPALVAGPSAASIEDSDVGIGGETPFFEGVLPPSAIVGLPARVHEVWVALEEPPQILGSEQPTSESGFVSTRLRVLLPAVEFYWTNPGVLPDDFWPRSPTPSDEVEPYIRVKGMVEVLTSPLSYRAGTRDTTDLVVAQSRLPVGDGTAPEVTRFHLATDQWEVVWDHLDREFVNYDPSQLLEFMQDGARTGAAQIAGRAVAGVLENLDLPHRQIGWRASSFEGGAVPGTQHLIAPMPSLPDAGDELRPSRQTRPTTVTGTETRIVVSGATQARARTVGLGNGGLRAWLGELAIEWQTVDDPFRESRLNGYRFRGLQLESLRECFQLGVENE